MSHRREEMYMPLHEIIACTVRFETPFATCRIIINFLMVGACPLPALVLTMGWTGSERSRPADYFTA